MRRVTPPRVVKPKTRALDASEDRRLLNAADGTDYYLPIHLAVYTGLRRSEILGLRWSDANLAARTLTVNRTMVSLTGDPAHIDEPKSRRSRRVVAFGRATEAALRPRRSLPHVQVCARANGNELHPGVLTHLFKKIAAACGIHDVRLHDLRQYSRKPSADVRCARPCGSGPPGPREHPDDGRHLWTRPPCIRRRGRGRLGPPVRQRVLGAPQDVGQYA